MGLATLDDLVAAWATIKNYNLYKIGSSGNASVGVFASSWRQISNIIGAVPTAGSGDAVSVATTGAIPITAAGAGKSLYLAKFTIMSTIVLGPTLMDRYVQTSGLSGIVTTPQAVNSTALPARAGNGDGAELYLEWYTATGATATNVSANYTNQAGVAGRTTAVASMPGLMKGGSMLRLSLQAGDTGVQSVQSVTIVASTLTAGNLGITICKRIASVPVILTNTIFGMGAFQLNLPKIDNNSCLFVCYSSTSTTSASFDADFGIVEAAA